MIRSVSNVNFGAEVQPQDLISSPGKYTVASAPKADAPADSFEKEGGEKKKSKAPAIIGTVVALLAAAYIGLGVAVGKKALTRAGAKEGKELSFMDNVKNFFVDIGESGEKLWNKIRSKKADDVETKKDVPDVKKDTPDTKADASSDAQKPEKAPEGENKPDAAPKENK